MKSIYKKIGAILQSAFNHNSNKRFYYLCYTLFFGIVCFFCFSWFLFTGHSLIWQEDGWTQHFKALVYYGEFLRDIVKNLILNHSLVIPEWDFYIGEGSDIVNVLHYYVMGDPLALFSALVPSRYMHLLYSFLCIFRMYLSGVAFSALCFGTNQTNRKAILTGSIGYSFCDWALLNAAKHPYFLNPMIWFPLMILGIEKILKNKKPYLFIISSAITAASNLYFFYMIVILAVTYTLIRLAIIYRRQIKQGILKLLYLGVMAVIGVCMAGIILLPILIMLMNDSRLAVSRSFQWLYPLSYYSQLPSVVISDAAIDTSYWLCMGYSAPIILAVFLMFIKKKSDILLKILFGIGILIILFPLGGRFLNGMSYVANRWSWAFALLCAYILVRYWNDLVNLSQKEWIKIVAFVTVFYAICLLFDKSRSAAAFASVSMLFIGVLIVRKSEEKEYRILSKSTALLLLAAVSITNIAFWKFAPDEGNYIALCKENGKIWKEWDDNEMRLIKKSADSSYTRISGRFLTLNANVLDRISSTQYSWSISNPYVNQFRSDLEIREPLFSSFRGYDDRTTPTALSSVQYYCVKKNDNKGIPFGYSFITESEKYEIYKNDYSLPIAYCYDKYLMKSDWDKLNAAQKQEIQLDAAVVDEKIDSLECVKQDENDYLTSYKVECKGKNIIQSENGFITTAKNTQIEVTLDENYSNSETYVELKGLQFVPTAEYDLYFGEKNVDPLDLYNKKAWDKLPNSKQISIKKEKLYWNPVQNPTIKIESSEGIKKDIDYKQPEHNFSSGRHDFIANLGFVKEPLTKIIITFSLPGVYSYDSFNVYSIPMNHYAEKITKLQQNCLQNIEVGTDQISGDITLDSAKLLCFATPFSTGWKAYVDGNNVKVCCLNERYLGIMIPAGEHTVRIAYTRPYGKIGLVISIIGIVTFCMIIFTEEKKKKKRNTEKDPIHEKNTAK